MSTTFERVAKIIKEETAPANAVESAFASLATGGDVPEPATATPEDLGTAAVGTSLKYAREDHVHDMPSPSDVGAIPAPESPISGQFLVYDGTAWSPATVPTDEQVSEAVDDWCGENIAQETGYVLDSSLTMSNAAAPADKVGELKNAVNTYIASEQNESLEFSLAWSNIGLNGSGAEIASTVNQTTPFIDAVKYADIVFTNDSAQNNLYIYAYDASKAFLKRDALYGKGKIKSTATNPVYFRAMTYSETISQSAQGNTISCELINLYSTEFLQSLLSAKAITTDDIVTGYYDTNGTIIPSSSRTRLKANIPLLKNTVISIPAGWGISFSVWRFDEYGNYIDKPSGSNWVYTFTIPYTGFYNLQFSSTNATNIVNNLSFSRTSTAVAPAISPVFSKPITLENITCKRSTTIKSIAHRGRWHNGKGVMCGASGVIAAKKYGFDAVENDVNLTSDGKMVMWHDATLAAIGRSDVVIKETTLSDLQAIDIGTYYSTEFAGEKILTFDEWINLCHLVGVDARIDFKITGNEFTNTLAEEMVQSVKRAGMADHVSYTTNFDKIRQYHTNATLVFLGNPTAENVVSLAPYLQNGEFWFDVFSPDLTSTMQNLAHDNGFGLEAWFAEYSLNNYNTKQAVFDEIYRACGLGISKFTLDDYRVEDVINAKLFE